MRKPPFISICIPAYQRAGKLERLLQSVATQTFTDYEIIISDDSPGDEVERLLTAFTSLPILYHKNAPSLGTPANWNKAIEKANGQWIKLMHDDDWFGGPGSLQAFADVAREGIADFIFSGYTRRHSASGKGSEEHLSTGGKQLLEQNPLHLFDRNVIGHPSVVMYKKDLLLQYNLQYKWVVDIDFYMRYLQKHPGFAYLPGLLVNIGVDETQVSQDCYKNPAVEIPEYLSLLSGYPSELPLTNPYIFSCVWNLVQRFRIRGVEYIRQSGYDGPLPLPLQQIINYQKPVPGFVLKQTPWSETLMKRCFRQINTPAAGI
ncbi:MAG TPA: glycosyltransferase [Chitinophagaceae bacterium]